MKRVIEQYNLGETYCYGKWQTVIRSHWDDGDVTYDIHPVGIDALADFISEDERRNGFGVLRPHNPPIRIPQPAGATPFEVLRQAGIL